MAFMGADMQFAGIWRAVQQLCNNGILTSKQLLLVCDYSVIVIENNTYCRQILVPFFIQNWCSCILWIAAPHPRSAWEDNAHGTFLLIVFRSNWNRSKKSGKPVSDSFENKIKFFWQDDGSPVSLPDTEIRVFNDMLPPLRCEIQIPSLVSLPVFTCPFDSHTPNTGTLSLSLGAGHSFSPASFCINQSHMEPRT